MARDPEHDPDRAVYAISVAAELVGSAPQNLRLYEARGLVMPLRSPGGTRRYSDNDLARLREIAVLLDAGLNLVGIEMVLELRRTNAELRAEVARAEGARAEEARTEEARTEGGGTEGGGSRRERRRSR